MKSKAVILLRDQQVPAAIEIFLLLFVTSSIGSCLEWLAVCTIPHIASDQAPAPTPLLSFLFGHRPAPRPMQYWRQQAVSRRRQCLLLSALSGKSGKRPAPRPTQHRRQAAAEAVKAPRRRQSRPRGAPAERREKTIRQRQTKTVPPI